MFSKYLFIVCGTLFSRLRKEKGCTIPALGTREDVLQSSEWSGKDQPIKKSTPT